jgi:cytochrome c-type biogenesis protein
MYEALSKISNTVSLPFFNMAESIMDYPVLVALVLGLIGALSPCQITANFSAITIYGNKTIQSKTDWIEVLYFVIGKILVFSLFGILAWLLGRNFESNITIFFSMFRKAIGPIIIIVGLFLIGIFQFHFINRLTSWIPLRVGQGKLGSFLMGVSFSVAFCPTMFVLFFVTLMPIALSSPLGFALPPVFGLATSIPVVLILGIMRFLEIDGSILKSSKKIGLAIQKIAGSVLIIVGILDTLTYWSI